MDQKGTLTSKQQQVLVYIKRTLSEQGRAPSLTEIAKEMSVKSLRSVTQYLDSLQRKGYIRRNRYAERGISLIEDEVITETIQIPVFASAGCGNPSVVADRTFDEFISVSSDLIADRKDMYVIKAIGNSLADAGIKDNDFVLVQQTEDVHANDLIVAIIDENAVIKKLRFADNATVLEPVSNDPSYKPIIMQRDFQIFGKVIQVIKVARNEKLQIIPVSDEYGYMESWK